MAKMGQEWRCLMLVLVLAATVSAITLDDLDDLVLNRPDEFCLLSDCLGQYTSETCPQGTRWRDGVAMGGCCGACVRFMQEGEAECTGKVDPQACHQGVSVQCTETVYTGYGLCDKVGQCPNKPAASQRVRRRASDSFERGEDLLQQDPLSMKKVQQEFLNSLARAGDAQVDNILQSSWCDFGMYCRSQQCTIVPTWVTCINTQEGFDRDLSSNNFAVYRDDYRWRPSCSSDGNYGPKQCKGFIDDSTRACMCVDPQGNTLPGKAMKFQGSLYTDMNCLCSRRVYEREQAGETGLTLHCAENGNFEPLQCEEGWCYCVHPENGTLHGSFQIPENALNLLPCYNRTLVGDLYVRKCDSMSHAYNTLTKFMFSKGVVVALSAASTCNYDGSYAPAQCTGLACVCVNKFGKSCLIHGTEGCECTQDQLTFAAYGGSYSELDCVAQSGAYESDQELSSQSVTYRVDKQGNRISSVVRTACKSYLQNSKLEQCQKVGNIQDTEGKKFCEVTCIEGNTATCPSSAYLYSSDYFSSSACLTTV